MPGRHPGGVALVDSSSGSEARNLESAIVATNQIEDLCLQTLYAITEAVIAPDVVGNRRSGVLPIVSDNCFR